MMLLNMLTVLNPSQLQHIDNISKLVIRESSDLDENQISDDDYEENTAASYYEKSLTRIDKLVNSKEPRDRQMIKIIGLINSKSDDSVSLDHNQAAQNSNLIVPVAKFVVPVANPVHVTRQNVRQPYKHSRSRFTLDMTSPSYDDDDD